MKMKLKVSRSEVWSATIEDRVGGAAAVLNPVAKAGADFEFVLARREPAQPGKGLLFVLPVKGAKVVKAAMDAGLAKTEGIQTVKVEGSGKPGTMSAITSALAIAGLSFRAFSAVAVGKKFSRYLAMDSAEDAAKAASVLKKL